MLGNIRNIDINKHFIHLIIKEFFYINRVYQKV
jgi:hypothetical protein